MRLLYVTDLHMTGFEVEKGLVRPRLPEHAWWALERRYDLMGHLLPKALKQGQAEFEPDLILIGGDMVDDGFGEYGRGDLLQVREVISTVAQVPVRWLYGNHDGPQEQFAELFGPLNWTEDCGGVRLIGLNSGTMDAAAEQESSRVAVEHLREVLATNEGERVIVALHQWIYPTDVTGYSLARAEEALELIEDQPAVVAAISGHYHTGRMDERHGIHYCTGRSLCEPPFCYGTFEVGESELVWREYALSPREKRFVLSEERRLVLRA